MNLPTSSGAQTLESIAQDRMETFTVERPTETTGARGGTDSTSTHEVDMWVFSPMEVTTDTEYGDRLTGSLGGLAHSSADVAEGDRITYQSVPYEVTGTVVTDEVDDVLMAINFERRSND